MHSLRSIPNCWAEALDDAIRAPTFEALVEYVATERERGSVFPPDELVFNALELTPLHEVRVVILGQDPYHDDGQAHGLSFSVPSGIKIPPSLRNIYRELTSDVCVEPPAHGCLEAWARQGVLLLNAVLTVRAHKPNSHRNKGWEVFTDAILRAVESGSRSVVFVLWGAQAQKKKALLNTSRHLVLEATHPSPLSAHNGFYGSRPFSKINDHLVAQGDEPIDWQLSDT